MGRRTKPGALEVVGWSSVITMASSLQGLAIFFPSSGAPELAELLASRRAVQLAMEVGVQRFVLEIDCQGGAVALADTTPIHAWASH